MLPCTGIRERGVFCSFWKGMGLYWKLHILFIQLIICIVMFLSLYMCLFVLPRVFGWNTSQSNVQNWTFSILHNMAHFLSFWHLKFQSCNQSLLVRCRKDWASQVALVVKNQLPNAPDIRDVGSIPELGRSPGGGHGNLLQYFCLENPMDRGAW